MFRSLHTIQISKRRYFLVRKPSGKFIHKTNDCSGWRTFIIIDGFTARTGTISIVAIVLTYRYHLHIRIAFEDGVYLLTCFFKNIWVGQTPLRMFARLSFTVNKRIIFGMLFAIYCRWKYSVERMQRISLDDLPKQTHFYISDHRFRSCRSGEI